MINRPQLRASEGCLGGSSLPSSAGRTPSDILSGQAAAHCKATPKEQAAIDDEGAIDWTRTFLAASNLSGAIASLAIQGARLMIDCGRYCESYIAVIACIDAGVSFSMCDERIPERRAQFMLDDMQPCARLSRVRRGAVKLSAAGGDSNAIDVEIDLLAPRKSEDAVSSHRHPSSEMYVAYTSGSTGRPKGVAVPVAAIDGLLASLLDRVQELKTYRRIGMTAALGFDVALQQMFISLFTGRTLAIPSETTRRNPQALLRFWAANKVDLADGTPTLLRMLAALPDRISTPLIPRTFLIGGEPLARRDVESFRVRYGEDFHIYNLYGVAECGIDSAVGKVEFRDTGMVTLNVGNPLNHALIEVVLEHGVPAPPGVEGEIWIGGDCLGIGYLNRPDEDGRFVTKSDKRFYRTGDYGALTADGQLWVGGRQDRQIKLAGRRFDPSELESLVVEFIRELSRSEVAGIRPRGDSVRRCSACVVSVNYPGAQLGESENCFYCRLFANGGNDGWGYFQPFEQFNVQLERARQQRGGEIDAVLLFSGGKDSSYVLHRLIGMGVNVHAFTFDNGYISESALENVRRSCAQAGVQLTIGKPADSVGLLAASMQADSTVCSGCFWGITAMGQACAAGLGAPMLITGLSRGQIIDTKLMPYLRRGHRDLSDVGAQLQQYASGYLARRELYGDAVGNDVQVGSSKVAVELIDYFRYDDISGPPLMNFLRVRDSAWSAPSDTGFCSTNCRANDAGIKVHVARTGYHNYEGPLSWDVRLGLISRAEAIQAVAGGPDNRNVTLLLDDLRKRIEVAVVQDSSGMLNAFVVAYVSFSDSDLSAWIAERVPDYVRLGAVHRVTDLPRTAHGKIDDRKLQQLADRRGQQSGQSRPADNIASACWQAWQAALGKPPSGDEANFFVEGGESLSATTFAVALEQLLGKPIQINSIFSHPTFKDVVAAVREYEWTPPPTRKDAVVRFRNLFRVDDDDSVQVMVLPGVSGLDAPLQPLFSRICKQASWRLSVANVSPTEVGSAWTWVDDLVDSVVDRVRGDSLRRPTTVVAGWSYGALLALEVAGRIANQDAAEEQDWLHVMLIDPPDVSIKSISNIRVEVVAALQRTFPQLAFRRGATWSWADAVDVARRALRYRDGEARLLTAMPAEIRDILSEPTMLELDFDTRLAHVCAGLDAAERRGFEGRSPSEVVGSRGRGASLLLVSSHSVNSPTLFEGVRGHLQLAEDSHKQMISPDRAELYHSWLAPILSSTRRARS